MSKQVSVTVRDTAHATLEQTFEPAAAVDLSKIFTGYLFLPAVVEVQNQTGPWDHVGVSRNPVFADGKGAFERITAYNPPTYFDYDVSKFTNVLGRLVHGAHGSWTFSSGKSADRETTLIEWTYAFNPRPLRGPIVRLAIAPIWRRYMRRALALTVREVEHAGPSPRR